MLVYVNDQYIANYLYAVEICRVKYQALTT